MEIDLPASFFHRARLSNKYDFGHLLIIGGSPSMTGAPLLSAKASLRMGAGLVTIASDAETIHELIGKLPEALTLTLPANPQDALMTTIKYCESRHVTGVVLGPGVPPMDALLVQQLCTRIRLPFVLDAGGLAAFNGKTKLLAKVARTNSKIVITPHHGEYQKLTGANDITQASVSLLAKQTNVSIVLKGDRTSIFYPDGTIKHNTTGNPGLATAGTGDCLAGMIGALLAQGYATTTAAESAVYIHGLAGDIAVAEKTEPGIISSDIIDTIPAALANIRANIRLSKM